MITRPPRKKSVNATGRNNDVVERHVRLHLWLLHSEAYRSLDSFSRALLVEFYALHNGFNNGDVFLSVREAARRVGCSKGRAGKSIGALVDRGFIRLHRPSAFNMKSNSRQGTAASYTLTEYPLGTANAGTKDFLRWKASEDRA